MISIFEKQSRLNRPWLKMGVQYGDRVNPSKRQRRMRARGMLVPKLWELQGDIRRQTPKLLKSSNQDNPKTKQLEVYKRKALAPGSHKVKTSLCGDH